MITLCLAMWHRLPSDWDPAASWLIAAVELLPEALLVSLLVAAVMQ